MECAHPYEMSSKGRFHDARQHGDAIFVAFAFAHSDLVCTEVYVFDPQPQTLQQPQPGAVQQVTHEPVHALQRVEQRFHLVLSQHDRETSWLLGAHDVVEPTNLSLQHVTIEKKNGVELLVLRRGADVALDGERGEKFSNDRLFSVRGMMVFEKKEKPLDPL